MVKMQAFAPDRVREKIGLLIQQVTPIEIALSEIGMESKELLAAKNIIALYARC